MRILYGITANGNGHLARSSRIVASLRRRGHEVETVVSGAPGKTPFTDSLLAPYRRFQGFSFADKGGAMDVIATIMAAKPGLFLKNLFRDMPAGDFDLAVTDFEPLVGWYARLRGIPSVGLCHMYAYLYPGVPMPKSPWYERLAYRRLAPADLPLGLHWFPYHPHVIPPFVEPVDCRAEDERKALVYLPWENPDSYVPALSRIESHRFIVYGNRIGLAGNVEFKKHDRTSFQADLGSCSTVLANAGFALASEALAHGKRLILKPYTGQPEQEHNAALAESLGVASRIAEIRAESLRPLLGSPRPAAKAFADPVPIFVRWLECGASVMNADTYRDLWQCFT